MKPTAGPDDHSAMNKPQPGAAGKARPVAAPAWPPGRPVVLQVLPALGPGGAERGAVQIAAALVAAGGTAIVASAGGRLVRDLERVGGRHVTLPVDARSPGAMLANVGRLAQLMEAEDVDIVHARSRAPAWSARRAARRAGRPFLTTFHGTYNFGGGLTGAIKRRYNAIMARGDRVIAISEFIAEHIRTFYPETDPSVIRVIDRGVDLSLFDPGRVGTSRVARMMQMLKLPDDLPVVMLPGRLTRWKGQTVFLEALGLLRDRVGKDAFCAVLIGDDQGRRGYRRELDAIVACLGLELLVRFADHIDDMPAAMMCADVVVSASTDPEAFGRVLPEAEAMGRPVVGTDHGGARNTVIPGKTGWLVPPGDAGALADAIAEALTLSPDARRRMGRRGMAHARQNFSVEAMCTKILAVYDEFAPGAADTGDAG